MGGDGKSDLLRDKPRMPDPTLTDETIVLALKWVGATIGAIFTLLCGVLGINKLAEHRLKRKYAKEDKQTEINDTNQGKAIDADQAAFKIVSDRLSIVETRLDDVQSQLRTAMENNATLTANNNHLSKDNDRLRENVKELREQLRTADITIGELRRELDILKLRVDGSSPFEVKLVDGDPVHVVEEKKK